MTDSVYKNNGTDKFLSIAAYIIGGAGLLGFGIFLLFSPVPGISLGLSHVKAHLLNTLLCLLFFLQHSVMIRTRCRTCLCAFIDERRYPAVYAVSAGFVLIIFLAFWQKSPDMVYDAHGAVFIIMRLTAFLACVGFLWGGAVMDGFDPLGTEALKQDAPPEMENGSPPLFLKGPYRYVRHPLYFCTLLMIWSQPRITTDRLLFNVLFTVWIVVGTHLEEKDLAKTLGRAYGEYQRTVPMLVPSLNSSGKYNKQRR